MASVYIHKSRGFQVRFVLYYLDGSQVTKYRYVHKRGLAEQLKRDCEFIERGSRSGSLAAREIVQARHDGLLTEKDVRLLTGGKVAAIYDLDRVFSAYRATISVSHTPVAFDKAIGKAALVRDWLYDHPVPTLTDAEIKQYILDRRSGSLSFTNHVTGFMLSGVKPKTILNELEIMRGMINEAMKLGMVETNVAKTVSLPVKTSTLRRSLSLLEIKALLASADRNRHLLHGQAYEFIILALYTGFRRAELRTLCWSDIHFGTQRLMVQSKVIDNEDDFTTKSGEARFKSIPDKIMPMLQGMNQSGRFVFGGLKPYNIDAISHTIKTVLVRAGLPDVSLHHCRHTYCSWLLRQTGGDFKLVQDEMGHRDPSTTKKYAHTISNDTDPTRSFDYD